MSEVEDEGTFGALELRRSTGFALASPETGIATDGSQVVEYHFPVEIEVRVVPAADVDDVTRVALERLVDALRGAWS
jgi:hypothetical protein